MGQAFRLGPGYRVAGSVFGSRPSAGGREGRIPSTEEGGPMGEPGCVRLTSL